MATSFYRRSASLLVGILLGLSGLAGSLSPAHAAPSPEATTPSAPPISFTGDGLTMIIRTASDDGAISGDIKHRGDTYPFTAQRSHTGNTETTKGSFVVGGIAFAFETSRRTGDTSLTFTSGGQNYTLISDAPPAAQPAPNPLAARPPSQPAGQPQPVQLAPTPVYMFEGDGLTIRILTVSDDGANLTGLLTLDGNSYPFTGQIAATDDGETVTGTFTDGAQSVPFSTTQGGDEEAITLTTRGRRFRIVEVEPTPSPQARAVNAAATSDRSAPIPAAGAADALPAQVVFHRVEFRDVNMGNVVAYTMLIPDGWQADGHIEWSNDQTPYPQRKITITAPDQSRIAYFPAMTFVYSEITDQARQDAARMGTPSVIPERQGMAPPRSIGDWMVANAYQNLPGASEVRLVSDVRGGEAERAMSGAAQAGGAPVQGEWEIHLVTISLSLNGVPFTEELNLTYAKNPPTPTRNINMYTWMLFVNSCVRAPAATFTQTKPILYASARSLRAAPKWWTQQQLAIMQITQNNFKNGMEAIRARGQFYDQMSDDSYASWKKSVAPGDAAQNDRINSIYEVEDFRDTDGLGVKLPIHYQNYYTDGKGNYLMSNTTMVEPGSEWTRIEPAK